MDKNKLIRAVALCEHRLECALWNLEWMRDNVDMGHLVEYEIREIKRVLRESKDLTESKREVA